MRKQALRRGRQALRRWLPRLTLVALTLVTIALIAVYTVPLPARLASPPSTVVTFVDGSPAHVFLAPDERYRMAAALEEVDPAYLAALLRFEDKRFYLHPGVDPLAVLRSAAVNIRFRRPLTGASTITMQLVRVLEPRPRRLRSKVVEAIRAVQLELRMSKEEILAAYLTFIPFGRNVEGVTAASWAYFGHGPEALTAEEIAVLLAVPQRPSRRFPTAANVEFLRQARDEIAAWLLERDALPRDRAGVALPAVALLEEVRHAPVPRAIRPLPRNAFHAAFWARQQSPGQIRLPTTLERGVQQVAERLMARARPELARLGIHNGAVVVVDHRTGAVEALVGNFDFWDATHGGQIPGFDVPRSPGSALKPLIYAMAIDRGLALPVHLVPDIPVRYGDYAPENYDGSFLGLVSLEEALSFSLNVPFVRLLGGVGVERFIGTLASLGAARLQADPGYYGLSAAIGSVEITPLELAAIFTTLAEGGRYRPLRWRGEEEEVAATAVLSPGAAFLTARALARRDRPDFPDRRRISGLPRAIHWKTGTSYGHRDAWAAGSGPRYTAVVWLGNFDNTPSVDLVGADAAGPILFDLLEAVADRALPGREPARPSDLKRVEVCAYSGHLPTAACEQRSWALALRNQVPTTRCPYHVEVDVDLDSGLALAPTCRAGRRYETRSYVTWPASVQRFLRQGHRWLPSPPSLAPGCTEGGRRTAPAILSPPRGQVLVLLPGLDATDQEIPLQAESHALGAQLSWFVNGEFLGTAEAAERLWWTPQPGRHEILVTDEAGLSARQILEVRQSG